MELTPQEPNRPAGALKDRVEKLPAACRACHVCGHCTQTVSLYPVLPWFERKHINTFRQLDCMNLGVLCVYFPLPDNITSPPALGTEGRWSSPVPQELIPDQHP